MNIADMPFDNPVRLLLTISDRPKVNHGRGADKAKRLAMTTIPKRYCAQCAARYQPVKVDQNFCCPEHRKFYNDLRQKYGRKIMDLAILWRDKRAPGGFAAFTAAIDAILRDHKNELGHAVSDGSAGNGRKVKVK